MYGHTAGAPPDQSYWNALRSASLRVINVSTAGEFNAATAAAIPGDCIVVSGGDKTWSISAVTGRSGTVTNPIVVMPDIRRGTRFTNQGNFLKLFLCDWWIIGGFEFNRVVTDIASRYGCYNTTFTDCKLTFCGQPIIGGAGWYTMADCEYYQTTPGGNNVWEYLECSDTWGFFRYVAQNSNAAVYRCNNNVWRYITVTRCADNTSRIPWVQLGAGSEILSNGSHWLYDTGNQVYGLLIKNWNNNYTETISIKTSGNIVRNNFFDDSDGQISGRIGDNNKVYNNLFIDVSDKYNDHMCISLANSSGSEYYNNIMLHKRGFGIRLFRGGNNDSLGHGHPGVKNSKVNHNTIFGSRTSPAMYGQIAIGEHNSGGVANKPFENVEVMNNQLSATSDALMTYASNGVAAEINLALDSNLFYPTGTATLGSAFSRNTRAVQGNPSNNAEYKPSTAGAAYRAGVSSGFNLDFYGVLRHSPPDIGAVDNGGSAAATKLASYSGNQTGMRRGQT